MNESIQNSGVYYRREDYAGFWRRLLIDCIDIVVLLVGWSLLILLVMQTTEGEAEVRAHAVPLSLVILAFLYLVLMKRSRLRTLGYIVAGAKVVNLQGERPGLPSMVLRLLFGALGPLNWLLDLAWLGGDAHRQAFRDKFAHTYDIKKGATPAGRGRIEYAAYDIFGNRFLFKEVIIENMHSI